MGRIADVAGSGREALGLVGAFAFLLVLLAAPAQGAAGLPEAVAADACGQTLAGMLAVAAGAAALATVAPRVAPGVLRGLLLVLSGACALAATALTVAAELPGARVAAVVLLGVATAFELYLGSNSAGHSHGSDAAVGSAAALLLATAFNGAVRAVLGTTPAALGTLGALLLGCAFALGTCPGGVAPSETAPAPSGPGRLLAQLRYDWQPLAGGAVCAFSLGVSGGWDAPADVGAAFAPLFAGTMAAGALLLGASLRRQGSLAAQPFGYVLSVAAAIGVLVWPFGPSGFGALLASLATGFSQTLFIGLLLIEAQSTGRELTRPGLLSVAAVTVLLAAWGLGSAAGLLPSSVTEAAVHTLLAVYLWALLVAALRSARAEKAAPESHAERVRRICGGLAEEYGLSQREGEVLPLLVAGLSAAAVAERLFISPQTVKSHTHRIYGKMGIHAHDELVGLFDRAAGSAGGRRGAGG